MSTMATVISSLSAMGPIPRSTPTTVPGSSYVMFAYCGNDPVDLLDSTGYSSDHTGDPQYQWAWDLGCWLRDQLWSKEEKQREYIWNGTVVYDSNGPGGGATIYNSYLITSKEVMEEYINANRGDDISGSTDAVVYEWILHNKIYELGCMIGNEDLIEKGKDVSVGNTIYDDVHIDSGTHAAMSAFMKVSYWILNPLVGTMDYIIFTVN